MLNKALCILLFVFCLLCSVSFANDIVVPFTSVPNQPYFQSAQLMVDSVENNTIILTLKSDQNGTARLFWANHYDPQFNQPKSLWFFVKSGIHDYYFNVPSQNPNWIGWTKALLIYPEFDPAGLEIKYAKIVPSSLSTNIASGWQEFWGPNGRVVVGSTINVTPASTIFGQPINIYAYWLTGIFFLLILTWQRNYLRAGKLTIYFSLGVWILLGLSTYHNNFGILKDNFDKYFGKSIEIKRAIAYGKDYYDFLVFVRNKLPKKPVSFSILSSRYAPELQSRIFLVPHILVDPAKDNPEYLLIFNPEPKQLELTKKYCPYAKLNQNAYILTRTK
jgi:hypothetical protein